LRRRAPRLSEKFFEQAFLEKLGVQGEQAEKDLIDEVSDLFGRMAAAPESSREIGEVFRGFGGDVGTFFDRL
jgi:hypothetical protein